MSPPACCARRTWSPFPAKASERVSTYGFPMPPAKRSCGEDWSACGSSLRPYNTVTASSLPAAAANIFGEKRATWLTLSNRLAFESVGLFIGLASLSQYSSAHIILYLAFIVVFIRDMRYLLKMLPTKQAGSPFLVAIGSLSMFSLTLFFDGPLTA